VGVQKFIPNEFGQNSQHRGVREKLPAKINDYLRSFQKARGNSVEWVGIATGTILDQDLLSEKLGIDLKWQSASVHGDSPTLLILATSLHRIGQLVSRILECWNFAKNSYVHATGCITSARQIVDLLEREMNVRFFV
jgi:hypothetical protein